MGKVSTETSSQMEKRRQRCLFGSFHLNTGMQFLVAIGTLVLLSLVGVLYLKFRRALFVLLLPASITVITVFAIITKRHKLLWPLIATSMFHSMLACYALLIFSFYFFFKPFYIIMVLNWAFNTLHTDKTPSYYIQCGCIYLALIVLLTFNIWQGIVSFSYRNLLRGDTTVPSRQPTVLVVNKHGMY